MTKMLYKGYFKLVEEIGELLVELNAKILDLDWDITKLLDEAVDVVSAIDHMIGINSFVGYDKFKSVSFMSEDSIRLVLSSIGNNGEPELFILSHCVKASSKSLQTLGKVGGFPDTTEHPDGGPDLHIRLASDLVNLRASCVMLMEHHKGKGNSLDVRYENKTRLFKEWDINGILVPTETDAQS